MPAFRPALILIPLLTSGAAAAAPRALIVDGSDPGVLANVTSTLTARGFTVDTQPIVPADLDAYCCVWDLRPFEALLPFEAAQYRAFLGAGHGLFLAGENISCCGPRDGSLVNAINLDFGGGPVAITSERLGTFEELADPFNPVTQSPNVIQKVTYNGAGVAIFDSTGSGDILTQESGWPTLAAVSWPEGTLTLAPAGRLVTVLDINWMSTTFAFTDNAAFLENIAAFLCPTTTAGMAVTITTPPFALECPATATVSGRVDAAGFDCVQPTSLAPASLAPAPQRDALAFAGRNGDEPGDQALLLASAPAGGAMTPAGARLDLPAASGPGLLAGTIQSIEVSVNGGPFAPVSSTTPALPAPSPVLFTAAGLPLTLGSNVVVIRATDDLGLQATALVNGTLSDTVNPVIAAPTCQDVVLVLDGSCRQSFSGQPSASDACDPTPTLSATPALPVLFTAPGTVAVLHTARDDSGNSATCQRFVTAEDRTAPVLTCTAPLVAECSALGGTPASAPAVAVWLAGTTASDNCSLASLGHNGPALYPSGCAPGTATTVTWNARDGSNNPASCSSTLTVRDSVAPAITTTPPALALECSAAGGVPASNPAVVAWVSSFAAADVCSATVTRGHNVPALIPSGCPPGRSTGVTFTATDGCGNAATALSSVTVRDTTAPALTVPAALTLECNGPGGVSRSDPAVQAWLALATTADLCGTAGVTHNAPAVFPSGCGAGATTTVTFTATDNCGNSVLRTSTITVRDTTAPALAVPPPLTLECNSPGGVPATDPAVIAWLALATASDVCDGATISHDAPALFPSGCGVGTPTTVTFRAVDNCGNVTLRTSTITVQDTRPPVVSGSTLDGLCLWPPNHNFYCIEDVAAGVQAADVCDPGAATISVLECQSSQPEDATGDGSFAPDCVISGGGRGVCLRSERQGGVPEGRIYTIRIGAEDGCQNRATLDVQITVPHDQSPQQDCQRPNAGKSVAPRR